MIATMHDGLVVIGLGLGLLVVCLGLLVLATALGRVRERREAGRRAPVDPPRPWAEAARTVPARGFGYELVGRNRAVVGEVVEAPPEDWPLP